MAEPVPSRDRLGLRRARYPFQTYLTALDQETAQVTWFEWAVLCP
jgi:hypothetical protein